MTAIRRYLWSGHASSEGGPILVASAEAYPSWGGATEQWKDDTAYRVHYYGPIVAKLAERFLPDGVDSWHQYKVVSGMDAARQFVRDLRIEAERIEPTLTMREQQKMDMATVMAKVRAAIAAHGAPPVTNERKLATEDWLSSWRDHIEGGVDFHAGTERVLHVDAKPDTDYARACHCLQDVGFVDVGNAKGVVWSLEGPGTAQVGMSPDGFLLLRTWLDDESKHATDARNIATTATTEQNAGEIAFPTGRVVVVWAPVAPRDLASDATDLADLFRLAADLNPPVALNQQGILGVGTIVRVPAGSYHVTYGSHEEEEWACRWIRFTHV